MRVAEYAQQEGARFRCRLCPHHCVLTEGQRGRCRGRGPLDGRMIAHNYGVVVAANVDPIEKKPLYHFFPGAPILSAGTYGCNLSCRFCQNADLSQAEHHAPMIPPQELVERAQQIPGNIGVAFTYNEPGIWFEYVLDTAVLLRQRGLCSVMVTNGFLESEPWQVLCAHVDAMNIDLKAFTDTFYRDICGGALDPVQRNIAQAVNAGVHVEITHLLVTGGNDRREDFQRMIDWLATISPKLPLHISRYFPRYKETAPATSPESLMEYYELAKTRLQHVFVGNLDLPAAQNTYCSDCGATIIERTGYRTRVLLDHGACRCGKRSTIVGLPADAAPTDAASTGTCP